jgi:hypothetical protein
MDMGLGKMCIRVLLGNPHGVDAVKKLVLFESRFKRDEFCKFQATSRLRVKKTVQHDFL